METPAESAGKKSISVRFVVSGTPFDVPLAELRGFPTSALYIAATTRVGELKRAQDGVPIITFARDVWAFRLLRHFIGSGELIVPANETERQLLLAEAGFYGLEAAAAHILESFGAPTIDAPGPAAQASASASSFPPNNGRRSGFSAPSKAAQLRYRVDLPAAERDEPKTDESDEMGWALQRQSFSKVFTDEDTTIRAQEYIARVAFAADSNIDATSSMPWAARFFDGRADECGKAEDDGASH